MAIQAQLYNWENINLGFPLYGGSSSSSSSPQDYWMMKMIENANAAASCGAAGGGFNQFYFQTQQKQPQLRQQIQLFQQQNQHHQQRNRNQNQNQNQCLFFENTTGAALVPSLKNTTTAANQNNNDLPSQPLMPISVQVEKQRQEMDDYIRSQNERLRTLIQEQRKQQLEMMLKKMESKAATLLRQKDEEIAKYSNRTMELEIMLKRLEMENMAWQRMAHEYEAMVFSLNNTLEQMREKAAGCFFNNNGGGFGIGIGNGGGAEDAESCCYIEVDQEKAPEEIFGGSSNGNGNGGGDKLTMTMVCKSCNSRESCVLFLPCRHLCSCKACDAFLESCPLCLTPTKARIEALIS